MTKLTYPKDVTAALKGAEEVLVLAPKEAFGGRWHHRVLPKALAHRLDAVVADADPGRLGWTGSSIQAEQPHRVVAAVLPDRGSHHNTPARTEAILSCVRKAGLGRKRRAVLVHADGPELVGGCLAGIWRAFPNYDRRTRKDHQSGPRSVALVALDPGGACLPVDRYARETVEAGRWAAEMVDTPTADMTTAGFVKHARALVRGLERVTTRLITTEGLVREKLMGVHSVGRAAEVGPRMLLLDYKPARPRRTVGLVGKGVVYDTGGLNIKTGGSMSTMKCDMAGAAAVVGAFRVLAATRCPHRVVAAAPLAENAVGPGSYRPDDILTMHSGRTVEINNTDAEGRLLLADGVSYVGRRYKPDALFDAATLTGAQLVATGQRHAAVVSNHEALERLAVELGRRTGDLAWPLPFAPEFFQAEFASKVADMRNSVKNRMNAQSACAAQFVHRHIDDLDLAWLHVDLAGPAFRDGRATGYGVALLAALAGAVEEALRG